VSSSEFKRHVAFPSAWLESARDVTVYVPPVPPDSRDHARPCLFLHDGQNLFDPERAYVRDHHWRVGETLDALIDTGRLPPLVVVGIDHGGPERIREYTPTAGREPGAGLAHRHARFLVDELVPFVQREYGIAQDPGCVGLGGSSLGGLATLYVASVAPGVFGRLLVMSPSVWWDRRVILQHLRRQPLAAGTRVWLDVGEQEGRRTVADTRRLRVSLDAQRGVETRYVEEPEGDHSEDSWARRLGEAVSYLFGP
jgi:enterochelin esterase-like enzyme